jgi:hypothetical protein
MACMRHNNSTSVIFNNNSDDPIGSNYKKNEQYWKSVATVYNSNTPNNWARLAKQIKDHFGRIKKRVAWFCAAWKEANALWASGESDVDLMNRAMQTYEEDNKTDGPLYLSIVGTFFARNQNGMPICYALRSRITRRS